MEAPPQSIFLPISILTSCESSPAVAGTPMSEIIHNVVTPCYICPELQDLQSDGQSANDAKQAIKLNPVSHNDFLKLILVD